MLQNFKRVVSWVAAFGILMEISACLPGRPFDEDAWRRSVENTDSADLYAPHRDESGRFFNPWMLQKRSFSSFLRWVLSKKNINPETVKVPPTPVMPNEGAYLSKSEEPFSITNIGHSTFIIHLDGRIIITDPFFSKRAAIPKRVVPPAFGPEKIPTGSTALISHNHYDHLDSWSIAALAGKTVFLCPLGLGDFLRKKGVKDVREKDWWESEEIEGTRYTCLPAQHWSRRFGQGYNQTLWCSWLIQRGRYKVYYGGDSGYFKGYREYGRVYPDIDAALLPIGAYAPRWFMHYSHTNIPEVFLAFQDIGARYLIPIQWGVLKLGDEPAVWPIVKLKEALSENSGLSNKVKILPVGGRLIIN